MRETFAALALREVDQLIATIEELQTTQAEHLAKHLMTIAALNDASDKFRNTVTLFTEQSKEELTKFLQRKAQEAAASTIESQRALLLQAVRDVVQREAEQGAAVMKEAAARVKQEFKRQRSTRLLELAGTAICTAGLVLLGLLALR